MNITNRKPEGEGDHRKMARKKGIPNEQQRAVMERHGLKKGFWEVVKELDHSIIVKHRVTGTFKVIEK